MADSGFHIDASAYFALGRNCQRAAQVVVVEMKHAGDRCGAIWERTAKGKAKVRTGHLRRSVTFMTSTSLMGSTTLMGSNVPYAKAQDTGSPAHIIRPRRGKFLRFPGIDGVTFARIVHHPGTRGNRFLTGSFQELKPRFKQEYQKVGAAIATTLRGGA